MLMSDMLLHTVSKTVLERNCICLKVRIVSAETLGTIVCLDLSLEIIPHK